MILKGNKAMEFTSLNELNRLRRLGQAAPWSTSGPFQPGLNSGSARGLLSPQVMAAADARARLERALAFHAAFRLLGRSLKRLARGLLPRHGTPSRSRLMQR